MSASTTVDSLVSKSLFISLMRRCKNVIGPSSVITNADEGKSISPSRISDRKAIEKLFQSIMPFTSMNRKISENWLWDSYNQWKLPVKIDKSDSLACHQQKVADVFNTLSMASPSSIQEEHQNNEVESEPNDQTPLSNEFTSTSEVDVDNEDSEDALRTLSNMKKYKINNLCYQNLFDVGWSKLGANMEEDRRWKQMLQAQEREQIKDAVDYYLQNQEKRKRHRLLTLNKYNPTMRWEMQLRHSKNNRQERLAYELY